MCPKMKDKISRRDGDVLASQYIALDLKQDIGRLIGFPFFLKKLLLLCTITI
jgi:hypothetical protein